MAEKETQRVLTGDEEEIFNPDENLRLIARKQKGAGGSSDQEPDPRKKYFENDNEDEEDEEDQESAGGEAEEPKEEQKPGKESPKPAKPQKGQKSPPSRGAGSGHDEEHEEDLEQVIDNYRNALKEMIEADEREVTIADTKEQKRGTDFQAKKAEIDHAQDLLNKLEENDKKVDKTSSDIHDDWRGRELSNQEVVKKYQELERMLAPFADQMAKDWLEIINNIASEIEIFKDKYYRSGKPDLKRLQRLLPEIEAGRDIEENPPMIYERIVEKIITELRPRALRVLLFIDNSGSMGGWLDAVRMSVMLVNQSLRSLRVLFRDRMREVLGSQVDQIVDIMVDVELWLFGDRSRVIRPFTQKNLEFLKDPKASMPPIDIDQETVATLIAFKKLNAQEGTFDTGGWQAILEQHNQAIIKQLLKENLMTEVIFQVSDGDIGGDEQASIDNIHALRLLGIPTIGFAIGAAGNAEQYLARRHGQNVIQAETPEQIVKGFAEALKRVVKDNLEKPLRESLRKIN